jgi:lipid-A-disaccharide synthase
MKHPSFMLIAGEASGDLLAAELVKALKAQSGATGAKFFGAGGAKMAEAGVELAFDMTEHSVIGLWEVVKRYGTFKRLFDQLLQLALERRPDVLICVDFSGFNRRFAAALRWEIAVRRGAFGGWRPRIVQFVSPQVWASRAGRARSMERDFDLLLAIFPFEKAWYAEHAPGLRVEFVGHPMVDRFKVQSSKFKVQSEPPLVVLLPGSRVGELKRHLPAMLGAAQQIAAKAPVAFRMVLPNDALMEQARAIAASTPKIEFQLGGLSEALQQAALAIASTGTVTMECAFFGVPTVTLYNTGWTTYQIGRRIVKVNSLTMPNLLAGEPVFPEFIQEAATPENISRAALALLNDPARGEAIRGKLTKIIGSLGGPGACERAAQAIGKLLKEPANQSVNR